MNDSKRILYITYDGLTDPLGQSQILPYIIGLSANGYRFTILSFEKKERFKKNKDSLEALTSASSIEWVPLPFTTKPPLVAKFYDAIRMRNKAVSLHKTRNFAMVHCRSYIAADVGLYMKRKFGTKFFFDMRGFWADEKKDGGHWGTNHPVLKRVYQYYKKKEIDYLQNADYIISLTHAGEKELATWPSFNKNVPLQVIPCCADMELFSVTDADQKFQSRKKLGIAPDCLLFSYLGNIGQWYMLEEMLQLFKQSKQIYPGALFLFVTHADPALIKVKIDALRLNHKDFVILEAPRQEVPLYIKASDINISFIKPVFSKISSSPTKLGEVLSMGIPVISNSGVGDVEEIVNETNAGYVVHDFSREAFDKAIEAIPELLHKSPRQIREKAGLIYSLDKGIACYAECYKMLLS